MTDPCSHTDSVGGCEVPGSYADAYMASDIKALCMAQAHPYVEP